MAWVKWELILNSFNRGGLNVGGLKVHNLSMIAKWWWRYCWDSKIMWGRVIASIYGIDGGLNQEGYNRWGGKTVWGNIIRTGWEIQRCGVEWISSFERVLGSGSTIQFWNDKWVGNMSLRERFPRLYRLETDKESVISARGSWENERWVWRWCWGREVRGRAIGELERLLMLMQNISPNINCRDSWKWKLDSNGSFSVKALRMILEIKLYEPNRCIEETLWNHLVPKKISIFVWRLMQLKLPVREALDHRGIELHSTLCPRCELDIETHDHCFINCPFALQVWERIFKWWTWDKFNPIQISELTKHPGHGIFSQFHILVWQATIWTTCYIIWGRRNEKVFSGKNSDINNVVSLIQAHVFERISIKRKSGSLMWNSWVENPVEAINLMAASTGPVESVPKGQAI